MTQKANFERRAWTNKEDQALVELIKIHGLKRWTSISQIMQKQFNFAKRSGKQCRERWHNQLNPNISKKPWSQEEEEIIFNAHKTIGNKTDNSIKNHFYATLRRSLRRINKLLGDRNSTAQIKDIKPGVLSRIFELAEKDDTESIENYQQKELLTNCYKLKEYLLMFARCPKQNEERKDIFQDENEIQLLKEGIQNIIKFNQIYQQDKLTKQQENNLISEANECTEHSFSVSNHNFIYPRQQSLEQNVKIREQSFEQNVKIKEQSLEQNVNIKEQSLEQNVNIKEQSLEQNVKIISKTATFKITRIKKDVITEKINKTAVKQKKKEGLLNQMSTVSQKKHKNKQKQLTETETKSEFAIESYLKKLENLKTNLGEIKFENKKEKENDNELWLKNFDDLPILSEYEIDSELDQLEYDHSKELIKQQIKIENTKELIKQEVKIQNTKELIKQEIKIENTNQTKNFFSPTSNFKLSSKINLGQQNK